MAAFGQRVLAAAVVTGFAALSIALGVRLSSADEPARPDLSELRDAVNAASKRGQNVDEIARALDALEKSLAGGWKAPAPGSTVPAPAELLALREAVEVAGRKGENVEEIRKQLAEVEKALTGQVLERPRPLPAPAEPDTPQPRPLPRPLPLLRPNIAPAFPDFPALPRAGGIDRELLRKAQELRAKALEMMSREPTDAEAAKLLEEAQELMLKALVGAAGRGGLIDPLPLFPELGGGRQPDRVRLGIRMEPLAPITAEQLNLDRQGVAIAEVIPGTVAEKIGLKANDIVIEFAGKPVSDIPEELTDRVNAVKPGEKVNIVVLRKGQRLEFKDVELPAPTQPDPAQLPRNRLGGFDLDGLDLGGFGFGGFGFGGNADSTSVTLVNDRFTIRAVRNGVKYHITGGLTDDGPVVDKILITDGDQPPVEANDLKDVKEEYRPQVEQLLRSISGRVKRRPRD